MSAKIINNMFPRLGFRSRTRILGQTVRKFSTKPSKKAWILPSVISSVIVGLATYFWSIHHQHQPHLQSLTGLKDLQSPQYCTESELAQAVNSIKDAIGATKVTDSESDLAAHTDNGYSPHPPEPGQAPHYIIYPRTTEEVSQVMKIAHAFSVPVVPFCGGSSLEGNFFSTRPGIVVDTSKMDQILLVNRDDLDVRVQAGVGWVQLNEHLAEENMMFGCDCSPAGKIGGMVSTNASGVNASRYGSMNRNIISLVVVLADGSIVKTKQRPRKSSAGYNLTQLFTGSEGTLGIVTEAVVQVHVKPAFERVAVGQFSSVLDATRTVSELFRRGVKPEAIEFLNEDMMHCTNYSGFLSKRWLEVPTLFFRVGGLSKSMVQEQLNIVHEVSQANQCRDFVMARDAAEGDELFSARKNALYAILEYGRNEIDENVRLWVSDIAVPLSRFPHVVDEITDLFKKSGFHSVILGHAGDGNLHADILYTQDQLHECQKVIDEVTQIGLRNEGTASGEHGIGTGKRRFLDVELGTNSVDLMRTIKMALDPKRILNPDKVFKIDPNDPGVF